MKQRNFNFLPDYEQAKALLQQLAEQSAPDPARLVDRPLMLYGAGNLGRMAKNYFDRINIDVVAVIDRGAENYQDDSFWEGVPVLHPDEISIEQKQQVLLAICIANICYSTVESELSKNGWHDIAHFYDISEAYRDRHPLSNGWFCAQLSRNDCVEIDRVIQCWHDDLSRAHHLQFIVWRHLRQDWLFSDAPMTIDNRYLIPEVKSVLNKHEHFVDMGAHFGDAAWALLTAVDFKFSSLSVFEPDNINRANLQNRFVKLVESDKKKIHVDHRALGEKAAIQAFFDGAGYASQLSNLGNETVNVIPFDSLGMQVSFIKLHLEGAELAALQGARHTLIEQRPIVVTTSYHNQLGLAKMAIWIMDTLRDYRFFYRLHSGCGTGAVIYAIPEERYSK